MTEYIIGDEINLKFKVPEKQKLYTFHLRKFENNKVLYSNAGFYPDDEGCISTAFSFSIIGSYRGIYPAGLFWSLKPVLDYENRFLPKSEALGIKSFFQLDVENNKKFIHSYRFTQIYTNSEITKTDLNEELKGSYFSHKNNNPNSCLLYLHGSGGLDDESLNIANLLCFKGFNTLCLNWAEPMKMEEISLEYFEKAMVWLANAANDRTLKIRIMGNSKGGEAALLLAAKYPERVYSVCAANSLTAPNQGINREKSPSYDPKSTWTYKGDPLPFIKSNLDMMVPLEQGKQVDLYPFYTSLFKDRQGVLDKTIDLSGFSGKVLLLSGAEDSSAPIKEVCELLKGKNPVTHIEHKSWSDAGHITGWPGYSEIFQFYEGPFLFGGSLKGNGECARESWNYILNFLS